MKAVIFDLDGTLTDSLESIACSVNLVLKQMELPEITIEQCQAFVGNGARFLIKQVMDWVGTPERFEEAMERYTIAFHENCTYLVRPYEGIPEVLDALRKQGVKTAVLSNKPDRQTRVVVSEILGDERFDYVIGQTDGIKRKPEPDGVWYLLDQMNLKKEDCLYVGDSEVDVETARRAGVKGLFMTYGFRTREQLMEAGAKNLADAAPEILEYV